MNADEIDPFTLEERDHILKALKDDTFCSKYARVKHSYYYPYIYFSFFAGARISEIIALQWCHRTAPQTMAIA
jgi:integrase